MTSLRDFNQMINAEIFTPDDLTYAVDTLADIRAQIAELKAREDTFKAVLIAAGHAAVDGTAHRAAVIQEQRTSTDWETIATKLNASRQLITAHTTTGAPFYKIRISARKVTS